MVNSSHQWIKVFVLLFFGLFLGHNAVAQVRVIVVPIGEDGKPLANIVTVAKSNGDFDNPVEALESIDDADDVNPYLIFIAPGLYDIGSTQLQMKPYVDISGSGEGITVIQGAVSDTAIGANSALVVGASSSKLRELTIYSRNGLSAFQGGIYIEDVARTEVENVSIDVLGTAAFQYGIYAAGLTNLRLINVDVYVTGGQGEQYGILNNGFTMETGSHSSVLVTRGVANQYGIASVRASSDISETSVEVSGGTTNQYGVFGRVDSKTNLTDSVVVVNDGADDFGVYMTDSSSSARVSNSEVTASNSSVFASTGANENETYISDSILTGGVMGDPVCSFTFQSSGVELDDSCQPAP
ncbi:MAG: hypothetical protein AAF402_12665 [Pseudomonadota bacterium]